MEKRDYLNLEKKEVIFKPNDSMLQVFAILFFLLSSLYFLIYFVTTYSVADVTSNEVYIVFIKPLYLVLSIFVVSFGIIIYNFVMQYFVHYEIKITYNGLEKYKHKSLIEVIRYENMINVIQTRVPYLLITYNQSNKEIKYALYSFSKEKIKNARIIMEKNIHVEIT